ncbi:MAG TPA: carbohydrate kinase family protein [Candidatus Saccharimonadales bacterium]|jgi:ribokinase
MASHDKPPLILCIGKATQDVFLRDEEFSPHKEGKVAYTHLPLGAKLDISEAYFTTGGNATNVAVTFARQGLESRYVWVLGSNDPVSRAVLAELDGEHVDTSYVVQQPDANASYSTILLATDGERTILNFHGNIPSTRDVAARFDAFDHASWVYPTALGRFETLERVVHEATRRGTKIMLNPAGSELAEPDKLKELLPDIDVLCLNREEMQLLVSGDDLESLVRAGLRFCDVVIVSDGPNGVVASDGKTIVTAGMYEDVPVIDRTGAGDAFASGFLSQWVKGRGLKQSIHFASANSTSVVGAIGAKPGLLHEHTSLHDMPITEKEF